MGYRDIDRVFGFRVQGLRPSIVPVRAEHVFVL